MMDNPEQDELRRELRIAPVMTGGTSLAVWIGGVTAELYRVTNGSQGQAAEGVDDPYSQILDLTQTDAMVDVITGTSAGGLNGVLLAAAWALGVPTETVVGLRDVWLELGSISALLRSPGERNPPSLLRGDEYFWPELTAVLRSFEKVATVPADDRGGKSRDTDLVVTVTTLEGEPTGRFDDIDQELNETRQAHQLRFRSSKGDFGVDPDWASRLALAARTSASIPGVFEASFLPVDEEVEGRPSFDGGRASFGVSRWAVDGGVLVNMPLGDAIERIYERPAGAEVRRVALYVNPTPAEPARQHPDKHSDTPTILKVAATAIVAPSNQGIARDVDRMREHNERAERAADIRRGIGDLLTGLPLLDVREMAATTFGRYRMIRTSSSVSSMLSRAAANGIDLPPGERARVEAALVAASRERWFPGSFYAPGDKGWPWGIAPLEYAGSVLLDAIATLYRLPVQTLRAGARKELGDLKSSVHLTLDQLAGFRRSDEAFWDAALRMDHGDIEAWAVSCYEAWPSIDHFGQSRGDEQEDAAKGLTLIALALAEQASALCALARGVAAGSPVGAGQAAPDDLQSVLALVRILESGPIDEEASTGPSDPLTSLLDVIANADDLAGGGVADAEAQIVFGALGSIVGGPSPLGDLLVELATGDGDRRTRALRDIARAAILSDGVPAGIPSEGITTELAVQLRVSQRLLALHVLAFTLGDTERRPQPIELIEVSWKAPNVLDPCRTPAQKLAGTELARLGAFVKRSWRANDWMWGRMDGCYQLVLLLLDPARLRQLGTRRWQVAFRFRLPLGDPVLGVLIREELEFLTNPACPLPLSLPVCAGVIAGRIQRQIAREELPFVYEAVLRSREEGAGEGDGGAFRREYERRTQRGKVPLAESDVDAVLRVCRIGDETAHTEIGKDMITREGGSAAVVLANALTGSHAGLGFAGRFLQPIRQLGLVIYAVTHSTTTASKTALGLSALIFGLAGAVLGMRVAGSEVNAGLVLLAATVLAVGFALALLRSGLWPQIPVVLLLVVVGLALAGNGVETAITSQPGSAPVSIPGNTGTLIARGAVEVTSSASGIERTETLHDAVVTVKSDNIELRQAAAEPDWKDWVFLDTFSVAVVLLWVGGFTWVISLSHEVVVATRQWKRRSASARRRGADRPSFPSRPVVLLIASVIVLTALLLFEDRVFDLLVHGSSQDPGRSQVIGLSRILGGQHLVVVVAAFVVIGIILGTAWDKSMGRLLGWARSVPRRSTRLVKAKVRAPGRLVKGAGDAG